MNFSHRENASQSLIPISTTKAQHSHFPTHRRHHSTQHDDRESCNKRSRNTLSLTTVTNPIPSIWQQHKSLPFASRIAQISFSCCARFSYRIVARFLDQKQKYIIIARKKPLLILIAVFMIATQFLKLYISRKCYQIDANHHSKSKIKYKIHKIFLVYCNQISSTRKDQNFPPGM